MRRSYGRRSRASGRAKRSPKPANGGSHLEDSLAEQIRLAGLPAPERQVKLVPGRRFLFDFAWPAYRLSLEVQGGEWIKGAHTSGSGLRRDCQKQALALLQGYRTLTVTGSMVRDGEALALVESLLRLSGANCDGSTRSV